MSWTTCVHIRHPCAPIAFDLDWAPAGLKRICELAGVSSRHLAALVRALAGDWEVNPAYRRYPGTVWQHPVNVLEPAAVAEVAAALRELDPTAVLATVPSNAGQARAAIGRHADGLGSPRAYFVQHFTALYHFFDEAVGRQQAVVLRWD